MQDDPTLQKPGSSAPVPAGRYLLACTMEGKKSVEKKRETRLISKKNQQKERITIAKNSMLKIVGSQAGKGRRKNKEKKHPIFAP